MASSAAARRHDTAAAGDGLSRRGDRELRPWWVAERNPWPHSPIVRAEGRGSRYAVAAKVAVGQSPLTCALLRPRAKTSEVVTADEAAQRPAQRSSAVRDGG